MHVKRVARYPHTMEAKLQSLRVPELKELLQKADLATAGNKPDLIKRLLENPSATASLESASGEQPESSENKPAPAATKPADAPAPAKVATADASAPAPASASDAAVQQAAAGPSDEERKRTQLAELEKRKARALRFGEPVEDIERKIQRIERFGLEAQDAAGIAKIDTELRGAKRGRSTQEERPAKATKGAAAPAPAAEQVSVRFH